MAYNFNYPMYNQFGQPMQQQQQLQPQNGGFVTVRSEAEARNYPVGYGNSVTFKDETAPYIYSKTMGYSQLDVPVFEKYKLVKEEAQEAKSDPKPSEADNSALDKLKAEIGQIWSEIEALKKEVHDDLCD
jgi:hypothetical protein